LCGPASSAGRAVAWPSFDHLVGAGKQRWRHVKAKSLGGFEVNYQLQLGRLLNWQIAGCFASKDAIDIVRSPSKLIGMSGP